MFDTSSKTKSCTQGMWIWGKPIFISERNIYVIIMDCEGFGSIEQSIDHDAKIFCLSVLLSSMIIYNSLQTIDEKAID